MSAYSSRLDITNATPENAGDFVCRYDDGTVRIQDTAKVTVVSEYLHVFILSL